jgi:energy-coupling factor transporter ATP-binding protein EcfA2
MDPIHAQLLARVVETYARALADAPEARRRLADLGATNAALVERAKVGFAAGTLASMARGEVLERLKRLGLVDASGRERFAGCITIPCFDESGAIVQIAGVAENGTVLALFEGVPVEKEPLAALGAVAPKPHHTVTHDADGFTVDFPRKLRFVVQGLRQDSPRHLRASIKAFRKPVEGEASRIHIDTLDLLHARSRDGFAKAAACLLGEDPTAMQEQLGTIVTLAEQFLAKREPAAPRVLMSESDRKAALGLLKDPKLLDRVAADLEALGHVGERENKIAAWVASLSRKLEEPISVLVVSRSAAGKSALAEAIAGLAPPEDVLRFTRLTAQALYYQKADALAHKLVLVEEAEGVDDAAYALRILQSSRRLSLSTAAGKGESKTHEVRGPVALFVTTTRTDLDEETAGRFLTLSVDESAEQTRAILAAQRNAEGGPPGRKAELVELHRNAQRLLEPVEIVNPYAAKLKFPDDRLAARRDHRKYLGLIRAVTFAHQYRRRRDQGAIVVEPNDIAVANRLAHHTLGQSIADLTPPSRRLLVEIRRWVGEREVKFSQRELREQVGWKRSQLAEHVKELVEAEYLLAHSLGGGRRARYALDWDGRGMDGERFVKGLVDVAELEASGTVHGAAGRSKRPRKGDSEAAQGTSVPSVRQNGEKHHE